MKEEEIDADTQTINEELKVVARAGQTRFYGELSELIDLPPRSPRLNRILDSINLHENAQGRPLLCALAVRRGFGSLETASFLRPRC